MKKSLVFALVCVGHFAFADGVGNNSYVRSNNAYELEIYSGGTSVQKWARINDSGVIEVAYPSLGGCRAKLKVNNDKTTTVTLEALDYNGNKISKENYTPLSDNGNVPYQDQYTLYPGSILFYHSYVSGHCQLKQIPFEGTPLDTGYNLYLNECNDLKSYGLQVAEAGVLDYTIYCGKNKERKSAKFPRSEGPLCSSEHIDLLHYIESNVSTRCKWDDLACLQKMEAFCKQDHIKKLEIIEKFDSGCNRTKSGLSGFGSYSFKKECIQNGKVLESLKGYLERRK
ncbi:MAG: hypothetical protein V4596_10850 [Bdellovibrionota bacterium]